jgi:hypothetical protein
LLDAAVVLAVDELDTADRPALEDLIILLDFLSPSRSQAPIEDLLHRAFAA